MKKIISKTIYLLSYLVSRLIVSTILALFLTISWFYIYASYFDSWVGCVTSYIAKWENELWCVYEYKNGTWWIASQYHVDRCWFDKWFSSEKLKEVVETNFKLISKSKWVWSCVFEMVDEEWKTIDNNIDFFSTLQCWISKMLFKVLPTPKLEEYNLTDFS